MFRAAIPRGCRLLALAWLAAAPSGCAPPSAAPAPGPRPSAGVPTGAKTADDAMRGALANVLQGQGKSAVAALRALDSTTLAPRYAPTRTCMLERLGDRRPPPLALADPVIAKVLAAYREYWLRALRAEHPAAANDAWLLATVNGIVRAAGGTAESTLDAVEPTLESLITRRGYHVLLGVTSPLRELMLWKTEAEARYDVALPEGGQAVTVVFMDDFASLGWAGFATCDRHHSGGWTKPDRLYAVQSAYDTLSENFRVSYLAHEGQHFADNRRFPEVTAQDQLEYRAKLTELAVATATAYELLDAFAGNVGTDAAVPHSYANGRVVRDMRARLGLGAEAGWVGVGVERINAAAIALLREDSARLELAH